MRKRAFLSLVSALALALPGWRARRGSPVERHAPLPVPHPPMDAQHGRRPV